jgi:hypothetical protein
MAQPSTTDDKQPVLVMTRPRGAAVPQAAISADAVLSEVHTGTNTVTDHPVEDGVNISDHSRPEPDKLQVELIVSDTPLSLVQMQRAQQFMQQAGIGVIQNPFDGTQTIAAVPGYSAAVLARLWKYKDDGTLLSVVTSLRYYRSMEIESISAPRDSKTNSALRCSISFKFVRVVQNKLTRRVVAKDKRVGSKTKTGSTTVQKDAVEQSQLDKGYENAKGKSGVNAVGAFVSGVFGGG